MSRLAARLDRKRELAPLLLRLFVAFVLVYGTVDNVFSPERMREFRDFLAQNRFPHPMAAAYLSAYAQFIAGILLFAGFFTRLTSTIVAINFVVALVMVHAGAPFNANIAPLAMLTGAIFFTIYGAPVYSLDARLRRAGRGATADAPRTL